MRQLVLTLLLALLCWTSDAAECTESEWNYDNSLWTAAAATSSCGPYVVTMDPVFIDAPCSDTGCLNVMEDVADSLTSCTISGVNYKINLQNALSVCTGGGTTTTTTTTTTPTPTSSSTTECTAAEYQSTEDLYDAAAATSACAGYSTTSDLLVTFNMPCSATSCVNVLVELTGALPDCLYDGTNKKAELIDNLGICTDVTTDTPDTAGGTTDASGGTTDTATPSSPTPASTASSTGCTTTEVNDMWDLYVSTATSDECAADSTVNDFSVYIFTTCDSECVDKIKDLAEGLPNCYYDYEFMNKKQDVLEELDKCASSNYYLTVTIFPDSTVDDTVTSTSTPISTPSGGSETLAPESGELPDTTLDSSTTGAESDTPQIFASSFQVMAIVVAAVFLTF
ncbi:hypothetical protein DVH05_014980 [Phytophthora capsici]|nr:hypothetical protein DVH05_014980 [Phytophthora capsici]